MFEVISAEVAKEPGIIYNHCVTGYPILPLIIILCGSTPICVVIYVYYECVCTYNITYVYIFIYI